MIIPAAPEMDQVHILSSGVDDGLICTTCAPDCLASTGMSGGILGWHLSGQQRISG